MGFPEGEFKIARFLGPQVRFLVGRSTVASQLRPRECVPAHTARSSRPSHSDAPSVSTRRIPLVAPRQGIQPAGYRHSRPTRGPGRGGVVLRLSYPAGCEREAFVGVEDPVPQPGNTVTHQYGRAKRNVSVQNSRQATGRWVAPHRVGFIPPLKRWAFASNNCKCLLSGTPPTTDQSRKSYHPAGRTTDDG